MSSDIRRVVRPSLEEMVRIFSSVEELLQDQAQAWQTIASQVEEGALQGRSGDELVDAIRNGVAPSLSKLIARLDEMATEVQATADSADATDQETAGYFG